MYFDYAQYKQKGFAPILIILGIVLVLGAIGVAYYFGQSSAKLPASVSQTPVSNQQTSVSPTQPPTGADKIATWKTYTNIDFGGEFKYPVGWILQDYPNYKFSGRQILISQNNLSSDYNTSSKNAEISFGSQELSNGSELLVVGTEKIMINGQEGKLRTFNDPKTGNQLLQASLIHSNKVFLFVSKYQNKDTFNQILSTFKFN